MKWREAIRAARTPMTFNDEFYSTFGKHPTRRHTNGGKVAINAESTILFNVSNTLTHEHKDGLPEDQVEAAMTELDIANSNWNPA